MFDYVLRNTQYGLRLFGLLLVGSVLLGCGGDQGVESTDNVPEWYLNEPEDENYVYAANSATSQKMQVAIDKATTNARGDLAATLETKIESMTKSFTEEISGELRESYTEAQKEITSQVLQGTSPKEKEVFQEDNGTWRAFVLMELPVGQAAKKFMSKLSDRDDEMYTRFRASEAFKEMEEAVNEFEEEQERSMSSQSENQ